MVDADRTRCVVDSGRREDSAAFGVTSEKVAGLGVNARATDCAADACGVPATDEADGAARSALPACYRRLWLASHTSVMPN